MKIFADTAINEVALWRNHHDYLLTALIIERGFGKWTEIVQCKDWQKWALPCHF
jgi:hypothetical protein